MIRQDYNGKAKGRQRGEKKQDKTVGRRWQEEEKENRQDKRD